MNNGYSICFNEWALDKNIKNELNLLLIISSLCAEKGYCYASNEYLAKLFDITEQSVSNKIKKLENIGYIKIEYKYRGTEVIHRKIQIKNNYTDHIKKFIPTVEKNLKDNNIRKNIISNNKIYYSNPELNDLFCEYLDLRTKLKAKNTDRAINLLLGILNKYDDDTKIQMINNSIMNSWKSVYPLKNKNEKQLPEWFGKEIKKEEYNEEVERLYKEIREYHTK